VILGAAFVPSTPLLVPEVARGAAHELDDVRAAIDEALQRVLGQGAERVVVLGAGARTGERRVGTGSLRGFGVDVEASLRGSSLSAAGRVEDAAPLPLSVTLGCWLLEQHAGAADLPRVAFEADPGESRATLASVASALAREPYREVLLVVADGSAARTEKAPAALHPRAEEFDASVASALRSGHGAQLAALDADLAREVASAGWPAWFVAGTALAVAGDGGYDAALHAETAPYGVGYLVASWVPRT
jgi:hypothetical protein